MSLSTKLQACFKGFKSWINTHNFYKKSFYKKNGALKRWLALFFTSFLCCILVCSLVLTVIANVYLGKIDREVIDSHEVDVPDTAIDVYGNQDIINIMLFGIDSRDMSEISRSDSIMLITVDKKHTKIKMTSIARDTRVPIEGYGEDKLNHAFAYGWNKTGEIVDGAKLALKTINNAFNLNVTSYVTANFWALAKIIDYLGGVDIDVDEQERAVINKNYIPYMQNIGVECEPIATTGMQHLSGGQAVAYCRVRYVGGDVMRGERQREVLMAMYEDVKTLNPLKYPELISLVLDECSTSLSNAQLLSLGTWALSNMGSLKFETLGIPTSDLDYGGYVDGVWYYLYDTDVAAKKIENFILETSEENSVSK